MNTLFDFVTHIKNIEYLASLTFIAGFLILNEVLKAKPFGTLVQAGKEDIEYIKTAGTSEVLKTVKRIIAAPFIGLAYVIALPFAFMFALASAVINGVMGFAGIKTSLGWRPMEAYLSGKKEDKKKKEERNEKQ
jgi:hypothetical protein